MSRLILPASGTERMDALWALFGAWTGSEQTPDLLSWFAAESRKAYAFDPSQAESYLGLLSDSWPASDARLSLLADACAAQLTREIPLPPGWPAALLVENCLAEHARQHGERCHALVYAATLRGAAWSHVTVPVLRALKEAAWAELSRPVAPFDAISFVS